MLFPEYTCTHTIYIMILMFYGSHLCWAGTRLWSTRKAPAENSCDVDGLTKGSYVLLAINTSMV